MHEYSNNNVQKKKKCIEKKGINKKDFRLRKKNSASYTYHGKPYKICVLTKWATLIV